MDINGILAFYKNFVTSMETKIVGVIEKTEQEAMKELSREIMKLADSIKSLIKIIKKITRIIKILKCIML